MSNVLNFRPTVDRVIIKNRLIKLNHTLFDVNISAAPRARPLYLEVWNPITEIYLNTDGIRIIRV